METKFFHSVTLDKDACHGCINCIKRCPTEAIRVRDGKAKILSDRCIDCGECIRVCPHHAKKAVFDSLDVIKNYKYKIALPAPALYGQFNNLDDIDIVLGALLKLGFDDVFEVAKAAEMVSDATRTLMAEGQLQRPVISSACPVVTRLIRVRFPDLLLNVLPLVAPAEIAARMAKKHAVEDLGYKPEDVGAFFISPCPAKVTAAKMP
ncbi:MAG: [Fe-Fe] hydrogenase large subunit C-terminal domain-containing protein, partial [Hydrogenoanaerobacterium sp.]